MTFEAATSSRNHYGFSDKAVLTSDTSAMSSSTGKGNAAEFRDSLCLALLRSSHMSPFQFSGSFSMAPT